MLLRATYQKHRRDVEQECNHGICQQDHGSYGVNVVHSDAGSLNKQGEQGVGDGACRGIVVQRHQGVHLEVAGAEEALDHDQPQRLGHDAADLEDEAPKLELDFAKGGNHHAKDDDGDVAQGFHVGRGDAKGPGREKDGNGGGSLD